MTREAGMKSLALLVLLFSIVLAPAQSLPSDKNEDIQYENEVLGISYPLSAEWVRESLQDTQNTESANRQPVTSGVLLAAVHVPKANFPIIDSSLTLRIAPFSTGDGKDCLTGLASSLASRKEAKQQGEITRNEFAGLDFYRLNVKPSRGKDKYLTIFCTVAKGYALQWIFRAESPEALEEAAASLHALEKREAPSPASVPGATPVPSIRPAPKRVAISTETAQKLSIKNKAEPIYPQAAKFEHIQGTVVFHAVIDREGNIIALEPLGGPAQLVPNAMDAVKRWRYKPYLLQGQPVEVETSIEVHFAIG